MFQLTINTDNAAFGDGDNAAEACELARILRMLAETFDSDGWVGDEGRLRDINGNTVGNWTLTEES